MLAEGFSGDYKFADKRLIHFISEMLRGTPNKIILIMFVFVAFIRFEMLCCLLLV